MCLQDIAIAIRYRTETTPLDGTGGVTSTIKAGEGLKSITLVPTVADQTFAIAFTYQGGTVSMLIKSDAGASMPVTLDRIQFGSLWNAPFTVSTGLLMTGVVVANYLDPDTYALASNWSP